MSKVMRHQLREYYGIPTVSGNSTTWTYHYINTGFTKLTESGGAQSESDAYIGDRNSTFIITGYENGWEYESQYIGGDPVCEDLRSIAVNQKTGSDCERKLISIDLTKAGTQTGTYKARQFDVSVEANPPSGEPKSVATMNGTIHQLGNFVSGVFDIENKTFTADSTQQEV